MTDDESVAGLKATQRHLRTRAQAAEGERDRLRAAYEGLLQLLDVRKAQQDRLRAVVEAAQTLLEGLDANPIGEYGDAVCDAIDQLDAKLKATKGAT